MPIKQKPLNTNFLDFSLSDFASKKTIKNNKKTKNSYSKSYSHSKNKSSKSQKSNNSSISYKYDKITVSNILNSIYSINNPINNALIKYNDKDSKLLNKEAYNNFKISKPFASEILNSYYCIYI